jgi:peptidyl-prolyl cis-trans isomerase C
MRLVLQPCVAASLLLAVLPAAAQTPVARSAAPAEAAAAPSNAVAATVNGQAIYELAVQRALRGISASKRAQVREEIINLLIDNVLVDQYLLQMRVAVDEKAVDKRLDEVKADATKEKKDFEANLREGQLTVQELRGFIRADLRWEAFAASQTDETKLKAYFESNKEMFDGSAIHARHILLTPAADDPKAGAEAVAKLQGFKKQIEAEVTAGLAKLPADADNVTREKERTRLTEATFANLAKVESACPTKEFGGDVGSFGRAGPMVEPFSRAAYACQPYQITDPVKTQYGYHLILVTDRKPGKEPKYDDVKPEVKNVYGEKLREAVVVMMRQRAKVEVAPVKP